MAADAAWEKGLDIVDEVYGPGARTMMDGQEDSLYIRETVNHLFAEVWTLPHLSIRDKRLLVIGATTMLGRADLLEIQLAGAIANEELTDAQMEEMRVLMLFYAGAGNTSALGQGIAAARKKVRDRTGNE